MIGLLAEALTCRTARDKSRRLAAGSSPFLSRQSFHQLNECEIWQCQNDVGGQPKSLPDRIAIFPGVSSGEQRDHRAMCHDGNIAVHMTRQCALNGLGEALACLMGGLIAKDQLVGERKECRDGALEVA